MDSCEMLVDGSQYYPELQAHLESLGYETIEDWIGYNTEDEVRYEEEGLRQRLDESVSQKEGEECDSDHFLRRNPFYAHNKYTTGGCSHTSNKMYGVTRSTVNDRCYGFSRVPYEGPN